MKKVTIITPPEYEGPVIDAIGKAKVTQFKQVTGSEFEALKRPSESQVNWKELYSKVHSKYLELKELEDLQVEASKPDVSELRKFALSPETEINTLIDTLGRLIAELKEKKEEKYVVGNKLVEELQSILKKESEEYEATRGGFVDKQHGLKAKLESVRALEPDELKKCFAVGVVKDEVIPQMEEYLKHYDDVFFKNVPISEGESFLFIFGSEESREWVEALFLVFDVKDIFDVLDSSDILLVLDPKRRQEAINKYKEELSTLEGSSGASSSDEKIKKIDQDYRSKIEKIKAEYDVKIRDNEDDNTKTLASLRQEQQNVIGEVAFYDSLLRNYQDRRAPVLRSKVISVIQGYTPTSKIEVLRSAIGKVEEQYGEQFFIEVAEPGHDEEEVPTPPMDFQPSFLQPLWSLTSLRGWPSADEINPGYITILIFCFQFGLMYGDIGQGIVFILLGYVMSKKIKSGMFNKLGTLMVPMGITAMIFGFMYDSIFLKEHLITHYLHEAHIHLPFKYPIMPNPVHEVTTLLKLVFLIAAIEIIIASVLGAINQWKSGHKWGILGEHGLGMILYVTGFYALVMNFIAIDMQFIPAFNHWGTISLAAGLTLSFVEPIIASVAHGHFKPEVVIEGFGGLLMTFVEGLANMFSFLRIAAFAIAHASLALAAHSMEPMMGIGGLVIMNVIALTFEFVSSSVQSLRLLYYELMGKFYNGQGKRFVPFRA